MADDIKPRLRVPTSAKKGEVIEVKTLITHPMETGQRKDGDGKIVPRLIVNALAVTYNGKPVLNAKLEPAVSALAVITWSAWAMLVFQIGTRLMPEPQTRADWGQLLRTTGFATAPALLLVFGAIPSGRTAVFAVVGVWVFAAMVFGVKHALDYRHTARALAVCALAAALSLALAFVVSAVFAPRVH